MTPLLDGRDAAALDTALRRIAAAAPPAPDGSTWAETLFADGADPDEPSRALLRALVAARAGVGEHLDTVPDRARVQYLQRRLGIGRRPVLADRLVAVVEADPRRTPLTLPKGARLKAGRGPLGERSYETLEPLRVLGAAVIGAHSHRLTPVGDRIARHTEGLTDGSVAPFRPFGSDADAEAPHELILASDLLRFDSGTATVTLRFNGLKIAGAEPKAAVVDRIFSGLVYRVPDAGDGGWRVVGADTNVRKRQPESVVRMTFGAPTAPIAIAGAERYALSCSLPPIGTARFPRADALRMTCTSIELVVSGSDVVPQTAYANDGLVDVTSELEPFGPVPHRGARFAVRSDEAFGKPLADVRIRAEQMPGTGGSGTPKLQWEQPTGDAWKPVRATGFLGDVDIGVGSGGAPFSALVEIAGQRGRYIRARITEGDYGWARWEEQLRTSPVQTSPGAPAPPLAGGSGGTPPPGRAVYGLPVAPVLTELRLGYTSEPQSSASDALLVLARNGLSDALRLTGQLHPFVEEPSGREGAFYVGLDARAPRGEVVSLYLDVDEADAGDTAPSPVTVSFAYDAGPAGWRALDAFDGTLGLRQSGIIRFVAPLDWADGSAAAGAAAGRWLRIETTTAALAGSIRRLQVDAVEARYVFPAGHEDDDPTPATPLPAGGVTALGAAVPGIKRVTNPRPSAGGRGPEPDAAFAARASGVTRHRNRAVSAWDIEELLRHAFPELALVRCLAHHSRTSECAPGHVAIVVVPHGSERAPVPTVRLAAAIETFVREHATAWAELAVLTAQYVEVGVRTTVVLKPGVVAGDARTELERALDELLHPLGGRRRLAGFGRPLFRSELLSALESHPLVEHVGEDGLDFLAPHTGLERIDVNSCRGLIAPAAIHDLQVQATL